MRLRSAMGSSMPSSSKPSMAKRTPRTCPAHRWPWATAARSRYSPRDFTRSVYLRPFLEQSSGGAAACFAVRFVLALHQSRAPLNRGTRFALLRRGPGMRTAVFDEREVGHEYGQGGEGGVLQDFFQVD